MSRPSSMDKPTSMLRKLSIEVGRKKGKAKQRSESTSGGIGTVDTEMGDAVGERTIGAASDSLQGRRGSNFLQQGSNSLRAMKGKMSDIVKRKPSSEAPGGLGRSKGFRPPGTTPSPPEKESSGQQPSEDATTREPAYALRSSAASTSMPSPPAAKQAEGSFTKEDSQKEGREVETSVDALALEYTGKLEDEDRGFVLPEHTRPVMIHFPPSSNHLPLLKQESTTKFTYADIPPSDIFYDPHMNSVMDDLLTGLVALVRNVRKDYPDVEISNMTAHFQIGTSKIQVDEILRACKQVPSLRMINDFNLDSFFGKTNFVQYLFQRANEVVDKEGGVENEGEGSGVFVQLQELRTGLKELTTRNIPPSILAQHGIFQVEYSKTESSLFNAQRYRKDIIRADGSRSISTPDLTQEVEFFTNLNKVVEEAAQPFLDLVSPLVSSNTFFIPEAELSGTRPLPTPETLLTLGKSSMWRITRFISVDLNEAADVGQDDEDEPVFTLEEMPLAPVDETTPTIPSSSLPTQEAKAALLSEPWAPFQDVDDFIPYLRRDLVNFKSKKARLIKLAAILSAPARWTSRVKSLESVGLSQVLDGRRLVRVLLSFYCSKSLILQITKELAQRVIEIFDLCLLAVAASQFPGFYMLLPDLLFAKAVGEYQKPGNLIQEDLLSTLLSQILIILRFAMAAFSLYSDFDFGNPGAKPSKYLLYQELVLAQSGLCVHPSCERYLFVNAETLPRSYRQDSDHRLLSTCTKHPRIGLGRKLYWPEMLLPQDIYVGPLSPCTWLYILFIMSPAARSVLLRLTWVQHWTCKNSRDKLVWKLKAFTGERKSEVA